jgi:glycosyltransferase involved in cell wall biosynthesis
VGLSILHVSQPVDGGVARCVGDLVTDQLARGWRVGVACPPAGPLLAAVLAAGAEHHHWPAGRDPGPLAAVETIRLARILRAGSPDLVHLHSSKAGLSGRLVLRGRRATVFQPHAWSFLAVRGALRAGALAWERRAASWADAVVCVSEGERRAGEEAGLRAGLRVVPNGIDLDAFRAAGAEERRDARERLGLGPSPLAVCVGRLSRQKGQDVLVDAWPEVASRVPGAELVLVGSGPDEAELRSRARGVGESDVRDWLVAANAVVQPSRWEGLAYTVLEAMATARAVVATEVAGMREALGEDASLVQVEDRRGLAAALAELLLAPDRADARGRELRERAEHLYDVRRATQAMADLYADVLERRSSQ